MVVSPIDNHAGVRINMARAPTSHMVCVQPSGRRRRRYDGRAACGTTAASKMLSSTPITLGSPVTVLSAQSCTIAILARTRRMKSSCSAATLIRGTRRRAERTRHWLRDLRWKPSGSSDRRPAAADDSARSERRGTGPVWAPVQLTSSFESQPNSKFMASGTSLFRPRAAPASSVTEPELSRSSTVGRLQGMARQPAAAAAVAGLSFNAAGLPARRQPGRQYTHRTTAWTSTSDPAGRRMNTHDDGVDDLSPRDADQLLRFRKNQPPPGGHAGVERRPGTMSNDRCRSRTGTLSSPVVTSDCFSSISQVGR